MLAEQYDGGFINLNKGWSTNKTVTIGGAANLDMSSSTGSLKLPSGGLTGARGVGNVISGQGATATLTAAQSGSTVLFDRAAGIVYTLPAPQVGLTYTFLTTVTITSNAAEVGTANESTDFMLGGVFLAPDGSAIGLSELFNGNGTTHVEISSNGTTTGGIKGSKYTIEAVSATLWLVSGILIGSGTLATPFST